MLRMTDISKTYGDKTVLRDFSITVSPNESVCLFGASGSGKSTVMRLACGLEKPDSGEVRIKDGARLAAMFQEDRLFPWETALANLKAVGIDEQTAKRFLLETGLDEASDKFPRQLSGGMKRRLSLARALAYGGDFYLLDEPFQGLDEALHIQMLELIKRETHGKSLLLITHNRDDASFLNARCVPISCNG